MKNIQKQYTDLLEGKMSKQNFMRNVRMEFPQYVAPSNSYNDAINILKSKRILAEAEKPEGVYGHNPNAEAETSRGIDHLNYYQVYHGIQYELAKMPEITDENYIKARKKVVDTILRDPDAYKQLQLANFKAVKAMDEDLKMKEVKEGNLVDKPNGMKVIKKDAKANTEATLEKKEKKKSKTAGVKEMTMTPKKAKGIAKVMEVPGKETLRESTMLREENLQQYAKKIADQHNLILMPQPLDKPQLYQMWKKEKGSFGNKAGVMTFVPNTKTVNVLSSDEKIPEAVFVQFKADKGGDDQGFETKTFAEDGAKGYFKNFSITDINEAKVKALREHILDEMTKINPEHEHFNVGTRVKKKDNSLAGEITEWDGDTATIKTDEGKIVHLQGNVITKKDVPAPKTEAAKTGTTDEWASPKKAVHEEGSTIEDEPVTEVSREEKIRSLKEKLMKTVKETKALVVQKNATGQQVDQLVQQKMPAAKPGDTVDIIRK